MRFKSFIKLLNEMSLDKALEVFGLSSDDLGNPTLLKKKFRDLSQANHPDHGGDVEVMKSAGRILSNETKKKISLSNKGKRAWNKGLTRENDKRVLNYSKKLQGSQATTEMKKNMSKSRKRWIKNNPGKALEHLKNLTTDIANEKRKHTIKKNKSFQGNNNPRYIKIDKKSFLKLYNQGVKLSEIATLFNTGLGTIRRRVNEYNLTKRKRSMII